MRAAVIRRAAEGLVDLLLPETCPTCGAAEVAAGGLCEDCGVALLKLVALPYCPRCGATVAPNLTVREDGCYLCPQPLPRFSLTVRLGPYADPLRPAIRAIKYTAHDALRRRLGTLLGEAVAARAGEIDVVMPVPMHWRRRLARGYDHARLLAKAIAGKLDRPLGDALKRSRHTPPQVNLSRSRRLKNVHGAFEVSRPKHVDGARVLLVDDATTTGATANEAARTLLRAGASSVVLAVIAKAEPARAYEEPVATS